MILVILLLIVQSAHSVQNSVAGVEVKEEYCGDSGEPWDATEELSSATWGHLLYQRLSLLGTSGLTVYSENEWWNNSNSENPRVSAVTINLKH